MSSNAYTKVGDEQVIVAGDKVLMASRSRAGLWYEVTKDSCPCEAFQHSAYPNSCRHTKALELVLLEGKTPEQVYGAIVDEAERKFSDSLTADAYDWDPRQAPDTIDPKILPHPYDEKAREFARLPKNREAIVTRMRRGSVLTVIRDSEAQLDGISIPMDVVDLMIADGVIESYWKSSVMKKCRLKEFKAL